MAAGMTASRRQAHKQCCPVCDEFEDLTHEEQIERIFVLLDSVHRGEPIEQVFDVLDLVHHYRCTFQRVHGPHVVAF
jgi:hypothetical protein